MIEWDTRHKCPKKNGLNLLENRMENIPRLLDNRVDSALEKVVSTFPTKI